MRVVIAIDKFKGTLTARQAADAIAEGLQDASGGRMALEIERGAVPIIRLAGRFPHHTCSTERRRRALYAPL